MRRRGQLQTAAHNRAFQRRDDRHTAIFHLVECLVPAQAQVHEFLWAAVLIMVFHQIQTGAEMITLGAQNNRARTQPWQGGKHGDQFLDCLGIQCVTFGRTGQNNLHNTIFVCFQPQVFNLKSA